MINKKILLASVLFFVAFSERVFFDLGPNIELVTTALILSAFYLGKKESFWLTFAVIAISDLIIGNSNIFLFTWSGFLIPAVFLPGLFKNLRFKFNNFPAKLLSVTGTGLFANLFFFLWTNLGVWLIGDMYSKTSAGLLSAYINGLPFLKNQLISSLSFISLIFVLTESVLFISGKYNFQNKLNSLLYPKNKVLT